MPLYNKPSKDLVYDLINEANPDLDIPITPINATLGLPTALGGSPAWPNPNTSILASAAAGSDDYIGKQTLNYRRLDLAALFRGMTVTISKYRDVSGLSSSSTVYTVYQLLADINQRYGMNLTEDDLTNAAIPRGTTMENGFNTNTITVSVKATSLGFIGTFQLKWINAKRQISDMVTVTEIPGRLFPGGNDFTGAHPDIMTSNAFGLDFTDLVATHLVPGNLGAATFAERAMNSPYTTNDFAFFQAALARINAKCGTDYKFTVNGLADQVGEFYRGRWLMQPSNNAATLLRFPEINSVDFNKVAVLIPPVDQNWGVEYLVLGFNL